MIQLEFTTPAESWVKRLCHDDAATVRILSMKAEDHNQYIEHFVDITSDATTSDDIARKLRKSTEIVETDLVAVGTNRLVGSVKSSGCIVCGLIVRSKSAHFVGTASTQENSDVRYKLFMSQDEMPAFLETLKQNGVLYRITDIAKIMWKEPLTARQEHVLKSALSIGYFDYPKRASTEDLARNVGISASTVTEILRRGERRIISGYFEEV